MSEQKLQSIILKYLKAIGAYAVKVVQASKAGVPDILCCYKGTFYGIEVKYGTNKTSALQDENLTMIEISGGVGIVAYSLKDVKEKLHE